MTQLPNMIDSAFYRLENGAKVDGIVVRNISKACHEKNARHCESVGDMSQKSWEDTPSPLRMSVISGVLFHLNNPEASASSSHESWLAYKEKEGWTYGEVKDTVAKTHPCFLPFQDLPDFDKKKDFMFKETVSVHVAALGDAGLKYQD